MTLRIALVVECLGAAVPLFARDNYENQVFVALTRAGEQRWIKMIPGRRIGGK